jgi:hypothetical protein
VQKNHIPRTQAVEMGGEAFINQAQSVFEKLKTLYQISIR